MAPAALAASLAWLTFLAPGGARAEPALPRIVRALTFNVWGLPAEWLAPRRAERMRALCRTLARHGRRRDGWDVVLLQEVWLHGDRAALARCGYRHVADADDGSLESGLLILSRWPMSRVARHTFAENGSWRHPATGEVLVDKGALAARVAHPRRPFWVVNTHLVANYAHDGGPSFTEQRRRQFEEVATLARAHLDDAPVIVGGDFNFGPRGPAFERIWDVLARLLPGFRAAPGADEHCTACPPNPACARAIGKLDHLFGSSGLVPRRGALALHEAIAAGDDPPLQLSDHFGWQTEFEIADTAATTTTTAPAP